MVLAAVLAAGGMLVAGGALTDASAQAGSENGILRGNVVYRERLALPPGTLVEIKLVDASRADAPASIIAEQRVEGATGSPIPFELRFESSAIRPGRSYALQARILVDGRLIFTDTKRHAVLGDNLDAADILVEKIRNAVEEQEPPSGRWLAEDIEGGGVIDRLRSTLEIDPDGSFSGNGGCNRLTGRARIEGASISFGAIAATNMACTPAVMDQEHKFFVALGKARSFQVLPRERKLLLLDGAGNSVMRLVQV